MQLRHARLPIGRAYRRTALQPRHADAYFNSALAAQQAHVDEERRTVRAYRTALQLAPRDAKVVSRLVTTLSWAGREAEAKAVTESAVRSGIWERAQQRPAVRERACGHVYCVCGRVGACVYAVERRADMYGKICCVAARVYS